MSNTVVTASTVVHHLLTKSFSCFLASITHHKDHVYFHQAVTHDHWINAMNVELDALELNNTWEITELPPNRKANGCKWVYKTKFKPDGTIDKYKARLVILGCRQTYSIDYKETFAPVAKMTTVRAILAIAAMQNWSVYHMDVSNAFLHGSLHEIVYMGMPLGYSRIGSWIPHSHGEFNLKTTSHLECRLKKTLYGLTHAPREWFDNLSDTLLAADYVHSKADYSLFMKV